ncbi:MAG: nuclear transport factor 2 family protein [Gemmatimonadaceae bacterium]
MNMPLGIFAPAIALTSMLYCSPGPNPTSQSDTTAVRNVVEQVAESFDHNDPALLDRLTTSDYTFVTPTGAVQNKEERLAPMRSGALHYSSAKYDEIIIRVYGSTAVATARVIVRATMGGADASGTFRATLVMAHIKNQWMVVASHASAIRQ